MDRGGDIGGGEGEGIGWFSLTPLPSSGSQFLNPDDGEEQDSTLKC